MYSTLSCLTINVPQMYNLCFYLNNVLNVPLQKPVVFQSLANFNLSTNECTLNFT